MKNKDLLKKLRQEADRIEPNIEAFMVERFGKTPLPKKKSWWQLLPSATLVLSVLVLGILLGQFSSIQITSSNPNGSESTSSSITTSIPSSDTPSITPSSEVVLPPLRLEGDKDALSVSTIATASLFSNLTLASQPLLAHPRFTGRPTFNFSETMTLIQPYLGMFEQLLGRSAAPLVLTETLSVGPYTYVDRFSVLDIQGNPINYELFYNLDNLETINEESFYDLSGELIINQGTPLAVIGAKKMEGEEKTLSFKAELDALNSIESVYKFEEDETKIRIRKLTNGVLNVSIFKLEVEDDETEIELLFLEENDEERVRDRFKFEYEIEEGENVLKIQFSITTDQGVERGKIKVLVVEILDENNQIIGYEYLAYNLNENDEEGEEWRDKRDVHDDDEDDDEGDDQDDDED